VTGDQHSAPLTRQRAHQHADPVNALGVKAVDRFVEQQHRRIADQRACDTQALAHAQ